MSASTIPSTNAYPEMKVQSLNGSSPQNASFNNFTQSQVQTAELAKLSGGKHRRKYNGGQAAVVVPQTPKTYSDQSIPSINGIGGIISNLVATSNQNKANAEYDNLAKVGGSRKRKSKKQLEWGCMSGGKTKSKGKKVKGGKSKKHRKCRK